MLVFVLKCFETFLVVEGNGNFVFLADRRNDSDEESWKCDDDQVFIV